MKQKRAICRNERRRLLGAFLLINGLIITVSALLLAYAAWARPRGLYFCAFSHLFHLYCPACGGTRAAVALLHLDVWQSLLYHPVVAVMAVLALYYDGAALLSLISGRMAYIRAVRWKTAYLVPLVLVLHFAVRNLLLLFGIDPIGDLLPYYL